MRFFSRRPEPATLATYPDQEVTRVQAFVFERVLQAQLATAIQPFTFLGPALGEMAKSSDWNARREAAVALARLGDLTGLLTLNAVANDDPNQDRRVDAIIAIGRVGHEVEGHPELVEVALKATVVLALHRQHHPDERVRAAATWVATRTW